MAPVSKSLPFRSLAFVLFSSTLGLTGCGGGNDVVEVKFPDVSKAQAPAVVGNPKAGAQAGPESKGDPSEYSQAK